jgi:hypothetical protein
MRRHGTIIFENMHNIAYQESYVSTHNSKLDFFNADAVGSHDLKDLKIKTFTDFSKNNN